MRRCGGQVNNMKTESYVYLGPRNDLDFQFGQVYKLSYSHLPSGDVIVKLEHIPSSREPIRLNAHQFEEWFEPLPGS